MKPVKYLMIALWALLFSSVDGQDNARQLNPADLKKDVHELRRALEKYHPGLYWYTSKEDFSLTWDSLNASMDNQMTDVQFFKLLLPVVAKVKCSHTLFYPSQEIISRGTRFPIELKFINGRGYIFHDTLSQHGIPDGSELLTINGDRLKLLVDKLLPSLQAQGGNPGWKYAILENDFQNYYYYIIGQPDYFEVEFLDHATKQKSSAKIQASSEEFLRTHWKNWYPKEDGAPLSLKFLADPDVAILTIRSLTKGRLKAYQQDFDKLLDQYFEEIRKKKTQNLIIDMRGNEGGNNPEKVYARITKENDKNTDGSASLISPAKNVFTGDVIVLMNERSISAQETFVSIFKNNNRGLTIGQPTPGCYKGLCGGKKHRLILPNSRLEIQIPMHASLRHYTGKVNFKEGVGFAPDFQVDENIDDMIGGIDTQLEYALSELRKTP